MRTIDKSRGERVFEVFNYILLTMLALAFLVPFLVVLSTSFVSEAEAARRGSFILFPEEFSLSAYKILLSQGSALYSSYKITIFRVVVGTLLNLFFTSTLAYGISKKGVPGRNIIITMIFITMIFGGGLIPTFLVVKALHLTNSIWSLVIPSLINTWNLIIMKSFFQQLPESLEESATIDGATPIQILAKIIFPVSLPVFATIGLFYAVSHWNAWFDAAIYINEHTKMPVQIIMRNIVLSMTNQEINNEVIAGMTEKPPAETVKAACIIVTTVPILFIYPFLQQYFVKGVMIGSIKG